MVSVAPDRQASSSIFQLQMLSCFVLSVPVNESYSTLLLPTTYHFWPHLNLTTILVKRNRALARLFFENV